MTHDDPTRILVMNRNRYASSWSWLSNPILLSRTDRTVYVRELLVQISNPSPNQAATLQVRVHDDVGGASPFATLNIPAGSKATWSNRLNLHVTCIASCRIEMQATGGGGDPAPVVHQIRLGTTTRMRPGSV
jgi:hypothetical protein